MAQDAVVPPPKLNWWKCVAWGVAIYASLELYGMWRETWRAEVWGEQMRRNLQESRK